MFRQLAKINLIINLFLTELECGFLLMFVSSSCSRRATAMPAVYPRTPILLCTSLGFLKAVQRHSDLIYALARRENSKIEPRSFQIELGCLS